MHGVQIGMDCLSDGTWRFSCTSSSALKSELFFSSLGHVETRLIGGDRQDNYRLLQDSETV